MYQLTTSTMQAPHMAKGSAKAAAKRFSGQIITSMLLCLAIFGATAGNVQAGPNESKGEVTLFGSTFSWKSNWNTSYGNNRTLGSGDIREETRAVSNFSRLNLAVPASVTVTQGTTESLTISVDDNLLPLINTRVDGNTLTIDADNNQGFSTKKGIKIQLVVRSLEEINIRGSGDIYGEQLKGEKLNIAIQGSGDVKFKSLKLDAFSVGIRGSGDVQVDNIDAKIVTTRIQGSGDIRLPALQATNVSILIKGSGDVSAAGVTDKLDVEISGSGDVRAAKLVSREANVKVQSSGGVDVNASEKLNASVSGSGDIRYYGAPKDVTRSVKGSGTISARG
jgi:Putative auto-transporter adhesin, head GIN domain